MKELLENIYFRGGLIVVLANTAVGGSDPLNFFAFIVAANLLVNCRRKKDD